MDAEKIAKCGLNCEICDNYVVNNCSCEDKANCTVKICCEKRKAASCLECIRLTYCKKRKHAINACFIITPFGDLKKGTIILTEEPENRIMNFILYHIYSGKKALIIFDSCYKTERYKLKCLLNVSSEILKQKDMFEHLVRSLREHAGSYDIIYFDFDRKLFSYYDKKGIEELVKKLAFIFKTNSTLIISIRNLPPKKKEEIKEMVKKQESMKIISSLSNQIRMQMLDIIYENEKATFTQLQNMLTISAPLLNFHINILRHADIIKQNRDGAYFLSKTGREIYRIIKKINDNIDSCLKIETKLKKNLSNWEKMEMSYEKYIRIMVKNGELRFIELLEKIKKDIENIAGEKAAKEMIYFVFGEYIETERKPNRDEIKKKINELVFIYLADYISIENCIRWANTLLPLKAF